MSDPRDASGYSATDLISMGFIATPRLLALVENTQPVAAIDVARFDAIVVAGGQAPMFSFESATDLHHKFVEFYTAGKIAAALCHGVAILGYAKLPSGEPFGPRQDRHWLRQRRGRFRRRSSVGMGFLPRDKHIMPWRIEDELKGLGPTTCRPDCGAASPFAMVT